MHPFPSARLLAVLLLSGLWVHGMAGGMLPISEGTPTVAIKRLQPPQEAVGVATTGSRVFSNPKAKRSFYRRSAKKQQDISLGQWILSALSVMGGLAILAGAILLAIIAGVASSGWLVLFLLFAGGFVSTFLSVFALGKIHQKSWRAWPVALIVGGVLALGTLITLIAL